MEHDWNIANDALRRPPSATPIPQAPRKEATMTTDRIKRPAVTANGKKIFLLAVRLAAAAVVVLSCQAQAAYVIDVYQDGPNVAASGNGALNLTGLVSQGPAPNGISAVSAVGAVLVIGVPGNVDRYSGFAGPVTFGPGTAVAASQSFGPNIGISGFNTLLAVPLGYVSGTPVQATASWQGATLASLGLTPGEYTWTWASDNFTIRIAAPPAPVTPTAIPTLGEWGVIVLTFMLGLAAFARSRRSESAGRRA